MSFLHPHLLWLLLLVPALIFFLGHRKHRSALLISALPEFTKATTSFWSKYIHWIRILGIILIITLFILLMARPQSSYTSEKSSKEGIDIFLALDVSESMLAEDLKPNRIEAAKQVISDFIAQIESDRVGIILFAGKPFTQSPLTFDMGIIREYIGQVNTESISQNVRGLSGTAIGDALLSAVHKFEKSEDRSKVLILLTDGEANTGVDPLIAAQLAEKENIKTYTIGIGRTEGAPLPYYDLFGNKQYARNRDGSLVLSTFDEKTLKSIAEVTNGKYFHAENNRAFAKIFEEINELEKKKVAVNVVTKYSENFEPYAWILLSIFLLFLAWESRRVSFP